MQNEVRNVAAFHNPILAIRQNRPVRVLAVGDQEGKSPVYLTVGEDGTSRWESASEVRIIDHNMLPPSQEQLTTRNAGEMTGSSRK